MLQLTLVSYLYGYLYADFLQDNAHPYNASQILNLELILCHGLSGMVDLWSPNCMERDVTGRYISSKI